MNIVYLLAIVIAGVKGDPGTENKLIVLLLDGVRWDYLDQPELDLAGFNRIIRDGVMADYMIPDFPTLSYPNYYSLMTGLHVESHGISGNYMYDTEHGTYFLKGSNKEQIHSYWWDHSEPLWITAVKQGKRAYMYYWPGCEVNIRGYKPTFCEVNTERIPTIPDFQYSIDDGVQALRNDLADLVGIYVEVLDDQGHKFGPKSREMNNALKQVDTEIDRMLKLLDKHKLNETVNIMIFSDHGMTDVSESRVIDITHYIDMEDVDVILEQGPNCYIWPKENKLEKIYTDLKSMDHASVDVYKKDEIPDLWFYKDHPRISPILIIADNGWAIVTPTKPTFMSYADTGPMKGYHGYDNIEEDMRAIFLATGPDFKRNFRIKPFSNINIYQVMCKVLNVTAQPHNGTWSEVSDMLKNEMTSNWWKLIIFGIMLSIVFLSYNYVVKMHMMLRKRRKIQ